MDGERRNTEGDLRAAEVAGSPWFERGAPQFVPARGERRVDVAIVGAGITGLSLADILTRKGLGVVVLERDVIGSGVTGGSTAKATVLHGARYHSLAERHGPAAAAAYADAQVAGIEHLRSSAPVRAGGVSWEDRAAVTYAVEAEQVDELTREAAVARRCGLAVELVDDLPDVPFPVAGAIRLQGQAQLDPVAFLRATAQDVAANGGAIFERSRVVGLDLAGRTVRTSDGAVVHADHVVLATGIPFAERGAFSARVEPQRSYALALEVAGPPPGDMMISVGSPTRSLRTATRGDRRLLLVGGEGHVTGREPHTWERYERLLEWSRRHFDVERVVHRWSAQDYESIDLLPYVGPLWPFPTRCLVATGYAKWGITNGVAAAIALAGHIEGEVPSWASWFDPARRAQLQGLGQAVSLNATTARRFVTDRWPPSEPAAPRCPHLGGVLAWNPAEQTWDCPLHGSRFAATGTLLQGPATDDLRPAPGPPGGAR